MSFDTIIVGGGPAGLTLATYLPGNTCLIEHENIGGCHRVRRDKNSLFAEHGPRVYSGAYVNVANVLEDIGTSFRDTFRPYVFSPEHIDGKRWYNAFSWKEMLAVSVAYARYIFDTSYGTNVSVLEWCRANNFSAETTRYVDSVCSFSDGAGASRYSLNEFLSGFDQHTVFGFYEPRRAHDKHLFPIWTAFLENKGVKIVRAHVDTVLHDDGKAHGVSLADGTKVHATRVIFAVPPASLVPVLKKSKLVEPGFEAFGRRTKYDPYWSVAFHFERGTRILDHEGFRSTPWGLIYLDMPFADERYKVLSVAAAKWDVPSPVTGKTLKQHVRDEDDDAIVGEILRQLRLPSEPVKVSLPTGTYYDTAFIAAAGAGHWPSALACCRDLFSVGTHNGLSDYKFTSMESAVQNALAFCGKKRAKCVHASDLVRILLTLIVAWVVYKVTRTIL